MQVYQFTDGQETYLVEAWNVYAARQKLEDKGVDPGHFALVDIEWEMNSQQTRLTMRNTSADLFETGGSPKVGVRVTRQLCVAKWPFH